jgi:hypothetical protein
MKIYEKENVTAILNICHQRKDRPYKLPLQKPKLDISLCIDDFLFD